MALTVGHCLACHPQVRKEHGCRGRTSQLFPTSRGAGLPSLYVIIWLPLLTLNANSSRHNAEHLLCAQQDQSKQFIHTNTLYTGNC